MIEQSTYVTGTNDPFVFPRWVWVGKTMHRDGLHIFTTEYAAAYWAADEDDNERAVVGPVDLNAYPVLGTVLVPAQYTLRFKE